MGDGIHAATSHGTVRGAHRWDNCSRHTDRRPVDLEGEHFYPLSCRGYLTRASRRVASRRILVPNH